MCLHFPYLNVQLSHQDLQHQSTHATHHHAVPMQTAGCKTIELSAPACLSTMVTRTQDADQNVSLIRTAQETEHALGTSAWIHALEAVV